LAWVLAVLLLAGGCSQNRWLLGKSDDAGAGDATDLKNPSSMARLCESRGQAVEAKRLYEEAILRRPKDPAGYHGMALLCAKQGRFKEAEPYFARALALAPNDAALLGDMGYFCYLCSRNEEAERYLRQALELQPNQAIYGNNLALVLGEQGRDKESQDLFRRFGTPQQACANTAFIYAQRGEYRKALEMYDHVLTQDPKDHTAALAMLQVSKLQDQQQRALREIARQSPQPPAVASLDRLEPAVASVVPSQPPPANPTPLEPAVANFTGPAPANVATERPIGPATPSDLAPAAAACSQVSAEVDLSDEEKSPGSEVRWPEGALESDRPPAVAP
jgi:Flp pilus assembly protein TadD